jgi:hypothetical protein
MLGSFGQPTLNSLTTSVGYCLGQLRSDLFGEVDRSWIGYPARTSGDFCALRFLDHLDNDVFFNTRIAGRAALSVGSSGAVVMRLRRRTPSRCRRTLWIGCLDSVTPST